MKKILSAGSALALIFSSLISITILPIARADTTYSIPREEPTYGINSLATGVNVLEAFIQTPGVTFANPGFTNLDSGWTATTISPTYAVEYGTISGSLAEDLDIATTSTSVTVNLYAFTGCSTQPVSSCSSANLTDAYQVTFNNGGYSGYTALATGDLASENTATPASLTLTVPLTATITQSTLVNETNGVPTSNDAVATAVANITPIEVTLANTGGTASVNALIAPVNAGPHIQLWAKDTSNNWYDISVTGWIAPPGMAFPAGYDATTSVYAISDAAGSYPLTVNLVNASAPSTILSAGSGTVTVSAPAPVTVASVATLSELQAALANPVITTINITTDISTPIKLLASTPVTINGGGHTISFTGADKSWISGASNYVLQVYKTNATINDLNLTGGYAALLVNDSNVILGGTIDVSGNNVGGIESSNGSVLTITTTTILRNTSEAYALPTVWEDGTTGLTVVGGTFTQSQTVRAGQIQYYLLANNASILPSANFGITSPTAPVYSGAPTSFGVNMSGVTLPSNLDDQITLSFALTKDGSPVNGQTFALTSAGDYPLSSYGLSEATDVNGVISIKGSLNELASDFGGLVSAQDLYNAIQGGGSGTVSTTFASAGTYTLLIVASDTNGTIASTTANIVVSTSPAATFSITPSSTQAYTGAPTSFGVGISGATLPSDTSDQITLTFNVMDGSVPVVGQAFALSGIAGQDISGLGTLATSTDASGTISVTGSLDDLAQMMGFSSASQLVAELSGATSTAATVSTTFKNPGTYTLSLTASDANGTIASTMGTVTVVSPVAISGITLNGTNLPASVTTTGSEANWTITVPQDTAMYLSTANYTMTSATVAMSGANEALTYPVTFADGTYAGVIYGTLAYINSAWTLTPSQTQTFETPGTWNLTAVVQDDAGAVTDINVTLIVTPTPTVAITGITLNMAGSGVTSGLVSSTYSATSTNGDWIVTIPQDAATTIGSANYTMTSAILGMTGAASSITSYPVTFVSGIYSGQYGTLVHDGSAWTLTPSNTQTFETPGTYVLTAAVQDAAGTVTNVNFTLNVVPSLDDTLSALSVSSGVLTPAFNSTTTAYTVVLPYNMTIVPTVAATTTDQNATNTITQATSTTGMATVLVTAQSGATSTYMVTFSLAPATTSILNVALAVNNSAGGSAAPSDFTVSVLAGNPSTSTFPGDAAGTAITIDPNVAYNVNISSVTNYTQGISGNCDDASGILPGSSATCTITETYVAPTNGNGNAVGVASSGGGGGGGGGGYYNPYITTTDNSGQVLGASTTGGQVLGASTTNTVALMQELQNLEQQLIALEFKANSCSLTFGTNLSQGMTSSAVKDLQTVLNYTPLTQVATTGPGSPNNESTYFGNVTKNAVIAFQNIFADQILTPNGMTSGNGYVGASTRSVLKGLCGK